MEYASEEGIKVRSDTNLKRLKIEKKKWTSKIVKTISKHKLISTSVIAFIVFSTINIVMIYSFMQILAKI